MELEEEWREGAAEGKGGEEGRKMQSRYKINKQC